VLAVGNVFFHRQAAKNAKRRQGIFDLAATIHDAADAIFQERDVESDEQSERLFECF
jgi:hypothetical protein